MQYANGVQTQEHIYQTARRLMHENGYKKTTYSMIANEADVPVGLVNYYYKKQELLERLYTDFIDSIKETIYARFPQLDNQIQFFILLSKILLTQIFSDPKTLAFHLEINQANLIPNVVHERIRALQVSIVESFHINMTPQYFYWCATAEYGARRELTEQNKNLSVDSPEFLTLVNLLSTITLRIAGVSSDIIDQNLEEANKLYELLDSSYVSMF